MPTFDGPIPPHVDLPDGVAVARLDASRLKTGASIYELGEELSRVFRQKSYRKYADNWVEFLHARKLPARTTCAKLMRIVEELPRETLLAKGIEWCFGRLRFSTLGEQMRNAGLPVDLMFENVDPDEMNATQLGEACKELRKLLEEAAEDDIDRGDDVKPPPPAPRPPKIKLARDLQRWYRKAGADHVIFGSFMKHGTQYLRIQVPLDQRDIILKPPSS